jgi:hypothetical protein
MNKKLKKLKTLNLPDAFFAEFSRHYSKGVNKLRLSVTGETKNGKQVKVHMDFEFACLLYQISRLTKVWLEERAQRMSEITSIDRVLPVEGI